MRQRIITLPALFLVVSALAIATPQIEERPPAPSRPVAGATIFQSYCASCHGTDGRGKGPVAGALRHAVPDLTTLAQRNGGKFPAAQVKNVILFGEDKRIAAHGSKEMPIWGPTFHEIEFDQDLGNVRLENVTRYIESIQRK
ncbi:MAG TPA: cytochrome c [Terriglobales bacterium]|nr:cytochrome c [Terriglobales bacterium]